MIFTHENECKTPHFLREKQKTNKLPHSNGFLPNITAKTKNHD